MHNSILSSFHISHSLLYSSLTFTTNKPTCSLHSALSPTLPPTRTSYHHSYQCPVLTPSQIKVLASDKKYSEVIDWILAEHCPFDLYTGVRQYQHYLDACYAIQKQINALQEKHMYYLEKRMEVLSDLENTNILGCILAHTEEFNGHPKAYASFFQAIAPFRSHITYLGTNVSINCYMSGVIALSPPTVSKPLPPYMHISYADTLRNTQSLCEKKAPTPITKPPSIPTGLRSTHGKRCHKCRAIGHIRHECPKCQSKKKVFFCK